MFRRPIVVNCQLTLLILMAAQRASSQEVTAGDVILDFHSFWPEPDQSKEYETMSFHFTELLFLLMILDNVG